MQHSMRLWNSVVAFTLIATFILGGCAPAPAGPTAPDKSTEAAQQAATATPIIEQKPTPVIEIDESEPLAPQVVRQYPAPGEEMPLDRAIEVTFDQPMDAAKTASAWAMTTLTGEAIQGEITWPQPDSLAFKPAAALQADAVYLVKIAKNAVSAAGAVLKDDVTFQVNTVGELRITKVFPEDGAVDVENRAAITVMFNRPIVPLTTVEAAESMVLPLEISPEVDGKGEWLNTSVYVFHTDLPLKASEDYTVRIKAGLKDANGAELKEDYTWQFTTIAPSIERFELPDLEVNPEQSYRDVPLNQKFVFFFLQGMDKASTEAAFSLVNAKGEQTPVTFSWPKPERLVIQPAENLALGTKYRLMLEKTARSLDGGELRDGFDWSFTTHLFPAVKETTPANGSVQKQYSNYMQIRFASPMRLEGLKEKIVIKPELSSPMNFSYNEWNWSVNIYGFKPSTRYEVTVLPGASDIYGNEIPSSYHFSFTTASLTASAYLALPDTAPIFRSDAKPMKFYVRHVNIKTIEIGLYRLSNEIFLNMVNNKIQEYRPDPSTLVRTWQEESSGEVNQYQLTGIDLQDGAGNPLPVGFYYLTMDSPQLKHDTPYASVRYFIVADANLTLKTTYSQPRTGETVLGGGTHVSESLVWMTDLTSGAPLSKSGVSLYDGNFNLLGKGVTDDDGLVSFKHEVTEAAEDGGSEGRLKAMRFVITDEGGDHFGCVSSDWGSGVSPYDFGIWSDFYSLPDKLSAYIYTDRPLYRPGQPVYFKGIVRWNDDLLYSMPDIKNVRVKISSYDETVYDKVLPLNAYGSFSGELSLDRDATLGSYTIDAYVGGSDQKDAYPGDAGWISAVSFSVAEYHKPEFQVSVSTDKTDVIKGEKFNASVATEYYSGGAAANATVKWALGSETAYFSAPDEFSGYSFMNDEEDAGTWERTGQYQIIASGEELTGTDGKLTVPLTADLGKFSNSQRMTFEATVTDQSGNEVSNRSVLTAHMARYYPGARAEEYIGKVGKPSAVEIAVLDWEGKPVAGRALGVEIFERRWSSVQEQNPDGSIEWKSSVENIPVQDKLDLTTDEAGEARLEFTPQKGGIYRALVTVSDDEGNLAKASAFIWVAGVDYIPWRQSNNRSIELISDRKEYSPGDTAEIMIASPYEGENYALVTVERGRVRSREVIRLKNNSTVYELPLTEDMAPNVYVSVIIIKGAQVTESGLAEDGQDRPLGSGPDFRIGIKEIKIDPAVKALKVEVTPDAESAAPGKTVTYTVKTSDNQGKPVSAEVSLALSDLATLSLMDPNSEPILDYFYAKRALGVRTAVPIVYSIESYNETLQDMITDGRGGGGGGGGIKGGGNLLGVAEVRQDFPDTAYWLADLVTNVEGQASVTVTLPDNLTTWRMDARALTNDTRVGQITQDIKSTKPLLVMPQTPRFLVAGDQVSLGAAIHNNTAEDLDVTYSLQGSGVELLSDAKSQVKIPAASQAYVSWEARVKNDATSADLVFSTVSGKYEDASRPTIGSVLTGKDGGGKGLPVYRYEVMETAGTSGIVQSGETDGVASRTEAILLPQLEDGRKGDLTGNLVVHLSPTLATSMTAGLDFLEYYPYECIEQTISRFLPNILTLRAIKSLGITNRDLETKLGERVNIALQRLYKQQSPDGGWGWWSQSEKSDLFTSAYVVFGLVEAKDSGYKVEEEVLTRGVNYLAENVVFVENLTSVSDLNRQAFLLFVLARAGKPAVSNTVQLFEVRQSMSLYGRAYLAQALYMIDEQDPRLKTLRSDFMDAAILSASGAHWEETQIDYYNWNTDLRTTAIILATMLMIDAQNELNANVVRWLMSNRQNGHWRTTQETVWTLIGLTDWLLQTKELEAKYEYTALVNGLSMADGAWQSIDGREALESGEWQNDTELSLDVSKMFADQVNRLTIARTQGPGNLYYSAFLNVALPVETVKPLERGIAISRSYYRPAGERSAIRQIERGETFLARLTIVAPNDLHYVVIDDPLPAGVEGFDQSLLTSARLTAPEAEEPTREEGETRISLDDFFEKGWGWQYFDHVELRDEKVVLSASYLPAGTYTYTYLVRATSSGEFRVIPPTAREFYFPDVYGRGAGSLFKIVE